MEPYLETQRRALCRNDVESGFGTLLPAWFARRSLATAVVVAGLVCQTTSPGRLRADEPPAPSPSAGAPAPLSRHQLVEKLRHAATWVIAAVNQEKFNSGTAWLTDGPDRLLVTNHHVIAPSETSLGVLPDSQIRVFFPETRDGRPINETEVELREGGRYGVRVVDWDVMRDLAVLQVMENLPRDAEPLSLARESIEEGSPVHAIGNPGGEVLWAYNSGTVRSVYQKTIVEGGLRRRRFQCVATTSPINPGDSGGPVVNDSGELVAVNDSRQLFRDGVPVSLETFAIDVSEVRAFLDEVRPMLHPKTADDYRRRGLRYLSRRRYDEAISDFDASMRRLSPGMDPSKVLLNRARAYVQRGRSRGNTRADFEKAAIDLTEALASKPGDPELLILREGCFVEMQDSLSAQKDFDEAIKSSADKRVKSETLAEAYWFRYLMHPAQDHAGEIQFLTEAIRHDPQNFLYHLHRGARLYDLGQTEAALVDAERAVAIAEDELDPAKWAKIEPHVHVAFSNRADYYTRLNREVEARRDYLQAAAITLSRTRSRSGTIEDAKYLIYLGRALYYLQDAPDAFRLFETAEKIAPEVASERTTFREKRIYFENKSQSKIVLTAKYHTLGKDNQGQWFPGDFAMPNWIYWSFEPGQAGYLTIDGVPIHADRLRIVIWNDRNEMISDKYLKEDFVLVPESYQDYVPDTFRLPFR